MIRRQCALEMGLVVPVIRIRDNIQLKPNEYVIKIKGNTVGGGELLLNHYLAMSPGYDDESINGIETIEPSFGLPALWIDESVKERAELSGYTVVDPPSVVATHLTELIKRHGHELIGRQETKMLVDNLRDNYPVLVDDLIPSVLAIGDVQKVLAKLLREKYRSEIWLRFLRHWRIMGHTPRILIFSLNMFVSPCPDRLPSNSHK